MKLKSLSLKNYRQYEDSTIEFGDGITGIIGLNGAGKSTLVEAIAWTLYGPNATRTGKEGIKRSTAPLTANVETQLIIEIGGTEYKIVRVLKGASQTADASIITGGNVIADSVKGVEKEVGFLLGMDWKSFYTSFFAKQKELNALTRLQKSERQEVIIRMLRIDTIDKVIDLVRKRLREGKLELENLKKVMTSRDVNFLDRDRMIKENEKTKKDKELSKVTAEIEQLESYRAKFKDKFNEDRALSNKHSELNTKIAALGSSRDETQKKLNELSSDIEEINKLEKELPGLEKEYAKCKGLKDLANKMLAVKEAQEESHDKSKAQIKEMINDLNNELKELEGDEQLLVKNKICPTCRREWNNPKEIKAHFEKEKMKINEQLKKLELSRVEVKMFDEAKHKSIIEQINELEGSFEKYPEVKTQVARKLKVEGLFAGAIKKREEIDIEIKSKEKELKAVGYDPKRHEQITEENEKTDKELKEYYNKRNNLNLEIKELSTEIRNFEKEINDAKEKKEKKEKMTRNQEKNEQFLSLVIEYKKHLISQIGPKLSEISGRLLTELTNGKYTGVELNEDYELFIFDGNTKYALSRFSGGEEDVANLCLRLAISQLIAESSGTETGFIILDEIFGSQDIHRKSSIIEALNQLTKQFRQIILITHVEDIKDTVENIIEVIENEEGISQIKA